MDGFTCQVKLKFYTSFEKKEEAELRNVGVLNENIMSCWCCINLPNFYTFSWKDIKYSRVQYKVD